MSTTRKKSAPRAGAGKQSKNLSLAPDAVERGEAYSRRHNTNVSRLVTDFLRALPLDQPAADLAPAVRRLVGVAAGAALTPDLHRAHLRRKHGVA